MANKDFKVKNGLDIQSPLPVSMGGTGQTSTTNTLNSLLPTQDGNQNKVLSTDGTNTTWAAQATAYQRGGTESRPQAPTAGDLYYNTDTNVFEQYTSLGWFPIAVAPGIPTGVTATNQPSGRAFNNGRMSVAFTPNASAGAPSSFVVTPTPTTSPSTFTGTSSPITVTGLASSTQYTYTVSATSAYGTTSASSASSAVTATTVPASPSISAVAGSQSAIITITAGATGGSSITQYSITSNPSTTTQTTSNTSYSFTGLTDGTSYTFTATAINTNGASAASSASNSITPNTFNPEGAYDALSTVTVPSGGLSSITFSGIPAEYKHIEIRGTFLASATNEDCLVRLSGDTGSNYSWHEIRGDGSSASARGVANTSFMYLGANSGSTTFPYNVIFNVLDFNSTTKFKTLKSLSGQDRNGTGGAISLFSGNWRGLTPVTSITIYMASGTFNQHSQFALYGVK
jgi:hypothetical protein